MIYLGKTNHLSFISTVSHADHNELSFYQFGCIQLQVIEPLCNSGLNDRSISLSQTADGALVRVGSAAQLYHKGPRPLPFCHPQHVGYALPHGHKVMVVAPSIAT